MSFTVLWSLLKLMSIVSVMPSNHLLLCRPFFLLASIFPSIGVFSNESALRIRWPKLLELQLQHQSFQYLGLISLRIDCFDLLSAQGTLNSLLSSVQSLSHVRLFAAPWTAAHQPSPYLTISQCLPKFMSIASVIPSSHLILGCPLLLLPSIFPSSRVFSRVGCSHQVT